MKKLLILLVPVLLLLSCKEKEQQQMEKTALTESIFLLDSKWQTQDAKEMQLRDLKGKNVVMVMIFTSCQTACPLLLSDMQEVASKVNPQKMEETTMVLVSIDPDNDTPEVLKAYARQNKMEGKPWLFLTSDQESVRELANVLAVKYKEITPIIFSHSNIITVFNKNGEMVKQVEGTVNAAEVAETVNSLN
jgi:protein SCO1/2